MTRSTSHPNNITLRLDYPTYRRLLRLADDITHAAQANGVIPLDQPTSRADTLRVALVLGLEAIEAALEIDGRNHRPTR